MILGDTELLRALATRELSSVASAIQLHLHLPPLDLDEARELLQFVGQSHVADDWALEELHRDARGNASGLVRLAQVRPAPRRAQVEFAPDRASRDDEPARGTAPVPRARTPQSQDEPEKVESHQPASAPMLAANPLENGSPGSPSLVPTKPPIRIEDGLVEVGWDGDLETQALEPDDTTATTPAHLFQDSSFNEELIEDHYAALQAWGEWTENHEKTASQTVAVGGAPSRLSAAPSPESPTPLAEERLGSAEPAPATAVAGIRAEGQHEFAPYSQLFTRLRPSNQP